MPSLNKVFLMGNLTRDPDLRSLPSGAKVCEMGLAVNRRFTNAAGQEVDDTCFVDIVVWGRSADLCKQMLEKGSLVMIEGRLQFDQWEDRNGGGKRSRLRVVADQVHFLNRRDGNGGAQAGYGDDYAASAPAPQAGNSLPRRDYRPSMPPRRNPAPPQNVAPEMPPMPPVGGDVPGSTEDNIPF